MKERETPQTAVESLRQTETNAESWRLSGKDREMGRQLETDRKADRRSTDTHSEV